MTREVFYKKFYKFKKFKIPLFPFWPISNPPFSPKKAGPKGFKNSSQKTLLQPRGSICKTRPSHQPSLLTKIRGPILWGVFFGPFLFPPKNRNGGFTQSPLVIQWYFFCFDSCLVIWPWQKKPPPQGKTRLGFSPFKTRPGAFVFPGCIFSPQTGAPALLNFPFLFFPDFQLFSF